MLQKLHNIFFALLIGSTSIIASDFEHKEKPASDNQESAPKKSTCASLCRSLCVYKRAASTAHNNTSAVESVPMLPSISAPTVDNKHTVAPTDRYALWKIFQCRANQHLEFKNDHQLVVVCHCPQVIIMNIDTGVLEAVSKEEENLYSPWERVIQTKSREIEDMSSSDELRAIKMHHKGVIHSKKLIRFEKIEMKHCRPDVVALSPNEQVLALGNRKWVLLYRASAPLRQNRLEAQSVVGSQPTHTRLCKAEEAKT